jgi:predicted XRE-type DNA-binding protein
VPIIECACGCGETLEKYDKVGRPRKYIHNHHKTKNPKRIIKENSIIDDNGCWIWQKYKMSHSGHGQVGYRSKVYLAHRFSYEAFNDFIDENKYVCHRCNNSSCVNPEHLYLGTQHDNIKDSVEAGTAIFNRIYSDDMVIEIRNLFENGMKQVEIAKRFDVSPSWISRIVRFEKRKDVMIGGD